MAKAYRTAGLFKCIGLKNDPGIHDANGVRYNAVSRSQLFVLQIFQLPIQITGVFGQIGGRGANQFCFDLLYRAFYRGADAMLC